MTRADAQEMVQSLLSRSARATDDFLSDVERMLGGRGDTLEAAPAAGRAALPVAGYDELSAATGAGAPRRAVARAAAQACATTSAATRTARPCWTGSTAS